MPRKIRNTAILAKIETTVGTDAVPTGAANALLVSNPTFDKQYQNVDRSIIRSYLGASEQLAGNRNVQIGFEVEVSGSGTAGTAPAWGPLLQACAMAETITAAQRVEYNPISTALKTITIYYYKDGVVHKALGCMGTFEAMLEEGSIPKFKFTFTGIDGGPVAQANPALTLTAWRTPVVVNSLNAAQVKLGATYSAGAFTGGTDFCTRGLMLNMGNEVRYSSMLGACTGVDIVDRAASGSLSLDLDAAQEVAAYTAIDANTLTSVGLIHGTVAGGKVLFFAPAAQRINPKDEDYDGRLLLGMELRLTPLSGNDELRIVAL